MTLDIIKMKKVFHRVLDVFQVNTKMKKAKLSAKNVSRVDAMQENGQQEMHRQCAKNVSQQILNIYFAL